MTITTKLVDNNRNQSKQKAHSKCKTPYPVVLQMHGSAEPQEKR